MVSTPDTSFSGSEECYPNSEEPKPGGPKSEAKAKGKERRSLPSPQSTTDTTDAATDDDASDDELSHAHTLATDTAIAVEQAYQAIWDSFCGLPATTNPTFHLRNQKSYESLHQKLATHARDRQLLQHFEDTRKDWDAATGDLTLRLMATPLHDVFKRCIESAIESQLSRITEHAPFKILSGSHSKIQNRKDNPSAVPLFDKSPDGQFYYNSDPNTTDHYRYPPFVLEVAYSQDEQDLRQTATSFLRNMAGEILTVLTIDIQYLKHKERKGGNCHTASLSLWTANEEQGRDGALRVSCSTHEFRGKDGKALPGELVLPLDLFLPLDKRGGNPADGESEVRLSFSRLSGFIDEAEERQRIADATPSPPRLRSKRANTLIWEGVDGDVTEEKLASGPKRRKTGSEPTTIGTRSRTRSLSQPRRSDRVRLASRGRGSPAQ